MGVKYMSTTPHLKRKVYSSKHILNLALAMGRLATHKSWKCCEISIEGSTLDICLVANNICLHVSICQLCANGMRCITVAVDENSWAGLPKKRRQKKGRWIQGVSCLCVQQMSTWDRWRN